MIIQNENGRGGGLAESEGLRRTPVWKERGRYGTKKDYLGIQLPGMYAAPGLKLTGRMTSERKSTELKFGLGRAAPRD